MPLFKSVCTKNFLGGPSKNFNLKPISIEFHLHFRMQFGNGNAMAVKKKTGCATVPFLYYHFLASDRLFLHSAKLFEARKPALNNNNLFTPYRIILQCCVKHKALHTMGAISNRRAFI